MVVVVVVVMRRCGSLWVVIVAPPNVATWRRGDMAGISSYLAMLSARPSRARARAPCLLVLVVSFQRPQRNASKMSWKRGASRGPLPLPAHHRRGPGALGSRFGFASRRPIDTTFWDIYESINGVSPSPSISLPSPHLFSHLPTIPTLDTQKRLLGNINPIRAVLKMGVNQAFGWAAYKFTSTILE